MQGLGARAGWDRPLWQRREKVRWQAPERNERSWGEKNGIGAKEIIISSYAPMLEP